MDFLERLSLAREEADSLLCVGLDPDPARLPVLLQSRPRADAVIAFCAAIIEATAPFAAAFKPNLAFFEAMGAVGMGTLEEVVRLVPETRVVIADGKRGDIGNTARMYARSVFEQLGCDACTVSPYMGRDAVEPFLQFAGTGTFVLTRTSNSGASDVQELLVEGEPLYMRVARAALDWGADTPGTVGLVVGATDLDAIRRLRELAPRTPFLIPGIGAQGGDPYRVVRAAGGGGAPLLVNSSRSILYASDGDDFAQAAQHAALELRNALNRALD